MYCLRQRHSSVVTIPPSHLRNLTSILTSNYLVVILGKMSLFRFPAVPSMCLYGFYFCNPRFRQGHVLHVVVCLPGPASFSSVHGINIFEDYKPAMSHNLDLSGCSLAFGFRFNIFTERTLGGLCPSCYVVPGIPECQFVP